VRSTPVVHDQAFPDRPVRIIDPFGAGGGVDVIARALASRLAAAWGQPAIVENHPGAGSTAAPALVAQAPPDGYTLLINTSAQAYSAARAGELPYDPLRDFVPVAALTSQPYVLVASPQSGITTIGELAATASGRPGEIRFASAGTGTGTHLAVAKLNKVTRRCHAPFAVFAVYSRNVCIVAAEVRPDSHEYRIAPTKRTESGKFRQLSSHNDERVELFAEIDICGWIRVDEFERSAFTKFTLDAT